MTAPANEVLEYEYRRVDLNDTKFMGPPEEQWRQSMHELLAGKLSRHAVAWTRRLTPCSKGTLIHVSGEELQMQGSTSLALKDGGYAAGLGVSHNLHCIVSTNPLLHSSYVKTCLLISCSLGQKKIKQMIYHNHAYPNLDPNGEEFAVILHHAGE